ncbi:MAG TPA: type I-E CRISPR-associated protein Cse2/CasB [Thermomicrobiales bacterium]|nr:type I-E CRISPR-associated protein Cse2/CasB [Thermomicrobiales bacterium]
MSVSTAQEPASGRLNIVRLVAGLDDLAQRQDRAALAALRRGLGKAPGEAPEMFPIIVPLLPSARLRPWDEACGYLVASLFGFYPDGSWRGEGDGRWSRNLGVSLRLLASGMDSAGPERRLIALLNSDLDDLGSHLRGIVALLRGKAIPIDWTQLGRDLLAWDRPSRDVQRRWATAFWGQRADASDGDDRASE